MRRAPDNEAVSGENLLFVGGHPALDFANTLMLDNGAPLETFTFYEDILHWLALTGLISKAEQSKFTKELPSPAKRYGVLEQIRAFRGLWKTNLQRLVTGKTVSPDFIDLINQFLTDHSGWQTLAQDAETRAFQLHQEHVALEAPKKIPAVIAGAMAQFLTSANLKYLRRCARPQCVLYFYDTTKSHRRQWCSMAICGNRHKVAKFRAKHG